MRKTLCYDKKTNELNGKLQQKNIVNFIKMTRSKNCPLIVWQVEQFILWYYHLFNVGLNWSELKCELLLKASLPCQFGWFSSLKVLFSIPLIFIFLLPTEIWLVAKCFLLFKVGRTGIYNWFVFMHETLSMNKTNNPMIPMKNSLCTCDAMRWLIAYRSAFFIDSM